MSFQYHPLTPDRREIRLIRLEAGSHSGPLRCELIINCLDTGLEYETLSYVWGDTGDTRLIYVENHEFLVTRNLESALRRLRLPDQTRLLWADAICINQSDREEKGKQVSFMGEIYRRCRQVLIWLGEEDEFPFDPTAIEKLGGMTEAERINLTKQPWENSGLKSYIQKNNIRHVEPLQSQNGPEAAVFKPGFDISAAIELLHQLSSGKHLYEMHFFRITDFPNFESCKVWDNARHSLGHILARPWWRRTWTVQEAVLPPAARVIFSNYSIDFRLFLEADRQFNIHASPNGCCTMVCGSQGATYFRNYFWTMFGSTSPFNRALAMDTYASKWLVILQLSRQRNVTDPRDSVFGLLGVLPGNMDRRIRPDYNLDVAGVYSIATKLWLEEVSSLAILTTFIFPDDRRRIFSLPSWTIDWNGMDSTMTHSWGDDYMACGNFNKYKIFGERCNPNILPVERLLLGNIKFIGKKVSQRVTKVQDIEVLHETVESWKKSAFQVGCSEDEFWRTIFLDVSPFTRLATHKVTTKDVRAMKECWDSMKHAKNIPAALLDEEYRTKVLAQELSVTIAEQAKRVQDFLAHLSVCYELREGEGKSPQHVVFTTTTGLFGVAPVSIRLGDEVCIVKGSVLPILLRPIDLQITEPSLSTHRARAYSFVGCCYLQGHMYGEALRPYSKPWRNPLKTMFGYPEFDVPWEIVELH